MKDKYCSSSVENYLGMQPLLQVQVSPAVLTLPADASLSLADAIVATVAFFDCEDYPLTGTEIHRWLWRSSASLVQVLEALPVLVADGRLQQTDAFYTLPGREQIIWTRHERYRVAERKYAYARRAARLLRYLPSVRMVAVCNNAAYSNARAKSDIDLFIITAPGRVWWTRLWCVLLLQLAGLRRHGSRVADRCCLSFYLAADRLDIADLALRPQDPYLVYWLATLSPIYDRGGTFAAWWQANTWIREALPNATPRQTSSRRTVGSVLPPPNVGEGLRERGRWLENLAKRLQQPKLERWINRWADHSGVAVDDHILKLHVTDRRAEYRQQWLARLAKQGVGDWRGQN